MTVFGNLMVISIIWHDFLFPFVLSIEMVYRTPARVFRHISKHLDVRENTLRVVFHLSF